MDRLPPTTLSPIPLSSSNPPSSLDPPRELIVYDVDSDVESPSSRPATPASSIDTESELSTDSESSESSTIEEEAQQVGQARHRGKKLRRRARGELQEPVDVNLTGLWDPELYKERDHQPPPERLYMSFDEAVNAVDKWAKDHGVAYSKQKWARGRRNRLLMVCNRSGKWRDTHKIGDKRKRFGSASKKIQCPFQFYLLAEDNTDPENCQWRVKHCEDRKSIVHNHPPEKNPYAIAKYRRATRTEDMRQRLQQIWPLADGAKQAYLIAREEFPEAQWTRQDIKNEYQLWQRCQLGTKTKVEMLIEKLEANEYFYK